MPFEQGNQIGKDTRFKPGESGNPSGRPRDTLKEWIEAELEKVVEMQDGEGQTKLQILAATIVDDSIGGCIQSRKMLIDRIYPVLSKHEIAGSKDRELVVRWQSEMEAAAEELDRILGFGREDPKTRN